MKSDIHPQLHAVKVHCSCGNEFQAYSTVPELRLDICGACHPYFSGKKRMMAAAGQVQKFEAKYAGIDPAKAAADKKQAQDKKKVAAAKAKPKPKKAAAKR